ncbi:MAG: paraslipin [Candidatus Sericytochromatia bacterium]|nr:paraslipin [Candidatus Sericytochromatia bacterium]
MPMTFGLLALLAFITVIQLFRSLRVVPQREAYVVERFGKYHSTLDAGWHILLPFIDNVAFKHNLRETTIDVPSQECFTLDNVRVTVDGVIYVSILDPRKASYGVTDYAQAVRSLAMTTSRAVIGKLELDKTFEERDLISQKVVEAIAEAGEGWGIQIHRYEVQNIDPPATVREAMEAQVTADRQRRAMISTSEGRMQSMITRSEGRKAEMISHSEGEAQRLINEAEGKSHEILAVAQATASSIATLADAIAAPGGDQAVRLRLSEKYIGKLGQLAKPQTQILLPADLTQLDQILAGMGLDPEQKTGTQD